MIETLNLPIQRLTIPERQTRWYLADKTYYQQLLIWADGYLNNVAINADLIPKLKDIEVRTMPDLVMRCKHNK